MAFSEVFKVSVESPEPAAEEAPGVVDASAPATDRGLVLSVPSVQEQQADADDLRRSRDTVELLRQEIAALRQEFNLNRQVAMWQSGQGLSAELTAWFSHMQELGVPVDCSVDAEGELINSVCYYQWQHEYGFVAAPQGFLGADLLAISQGDWHSSSLRCAKQLNRQLLRPLLGQTPLHSRSLFRQD